MVSSRYHSKWEYMLHMTRFLAAFLFCSCIAIAQSTPPVPAATQSQPAVTTTQSPEVTQFQKIEDSWADAINKHDQYALELVLSPLFVDVAASGDITTRNQQLVQVMTGEDKTLYLTQKVITVRMLGDIAVANGTYTLHHKVNSAQIDEKVSSPTSSSVSAVAGSASTRNAPRSAKTRTESRRSLPPPSPPSISRCSPKATRTTRSLNSA